MDMSPPMNFFLPNISSHDYLLQSLFSLFLYSKLLLPFPSYFSLNPNTTISPTLFSIMLQCLHSCLWSAWCLTVPCYSVWKHLRLHPFPAPQKATACRTQPGGGAADAAALSVNDPPGNDLAHIKHRMEKTKVTDLGLLSYLPEAGPSHRPFLSPYTLDHFSRLDEDVVHEEAG